MAGKGTRAVGLALAAFGCCLAIAGGASAGSGPTERIVGGDVADPADWPFIAAIASRSGDQFCGGSVVAEEAVVTAAHCVVGSRPRNVHVITGRPDLDEESDGKEIKVEEISVHREYLRKRTSRHRGPEPQGDQPRRPPSCCRRWLRTSPRPSQATSCGSPGGAGPRPTGGNPSDVLLDVALFAISDAECSTHFSFFRPTEEVCAFGEEVSPDALQRLLLRRQRRSPDRRCLTRRAPRRDRLVRGLQVRSQEARRLHPGRRQPGLHRAARRPAVSARPLPRARIVPPRWPCPAADRASLRGAVSYHGSHRIGTRRGRSGSIPRQ